MPVNAYETERLARRLGLDEGAFRQRFTRRGAGRELAHQASGDCIFLGETGCAVYEDRPLTCRLYPLRRTVGADGKERWRHAPPHPKTLGDYAITGTIADFLDVQDVHAHLRAADDEAAGTGD